MTELIMVALLMCTTGDAECTARELKTFTFIHICDIEPENKGKDSWTGTIGGEKYAILLNARCEDY